MIKPLLILLLLCSTAVSVAAQSGRKVIRQTPPPIQPPLNSEPELPPAPPEELRVVSEEFFEHRINSLDNGSFRLADFSGKVIVVNLWATWCGPCRSEVPEYEKVRKAYAGKRVEFIGLTTEDPRTSFDRVRKFVRDFNFGFRLGWADRDIARTLMNGRNAIPQTVVFAQDGRVLSHWTGYAHGSSGDRLRQAIEQGLSESSPAAR